MTRPTILTTLSSNPSEITSSVPVPQPPYTLTSSLPESKPAGDINGDGYVDLLIGSPTYNGGSPNGIGRSYVIFGGRSYVVYASSGIRSVHNDAIMQLEEYLKTRPEKSFENWLEDAELLPYLQAASQAYFKENCYSQENLIAILQKYNLLPAIEKDETSPEKAVVLLWCQEKIFHQDPKFISGFIDDILFVAAKPYPLIQALLEIKDEKAITAVWCVENRSILANNFLKRIIYRISESSIDFQEAYSLIALFLQKGYLNFNDRQMQDLVKYLLRDVMTELCSLVKDSITCYYAQSILALLKVDKSFDFFSRDVCNWKNNLFKKYQDTDHLEFKIGLSDVAAVMPKLPDDPQIQIMTKYRMQAGLVIMASLEPFFPTMLITLIETYLNPPPLKMEVDNHVLTQSARHGQTLLADNRSQNGHTLHLLLDDSSRAKISDFGLSKW